MPETIAVRTQTRSGRSRGPGRPSSAVPKSRNLYLPSTITSLFTMFRDQLPDPDEVWAAGGLSYTDYYALLRDGHASSCLDQRMSQTLSHQIRVQPGEGAEGPLAERALACCRATLRNWGFQGREQFLTQVLYARFMGMMPFELNWYWDPDVEANLIDVPMDLMQEWFVYTPDGELRLRRSMASYQTEAPPPFKVFMARNQPSLRNPYGRKLLSPCYWPITFKRGGMRFFAEYAERFGMPTIQIKAATGTKDAKLQAYANRVIRMMRKGVLVSTGEFTAEHLDMESKYQTTHLYDSYMDAMDKETSKALLGQTLTTDEGGSRAQGDIHKQILETLWRADDKFIAQEISALFEMIVYVNFGPRVISPVAVVGEQLGTERLERDKVLRDYHGIEFTPEYMQRNYDLAPGDYVRVDPLKASYKDLPESNTSPKDGGSRPSEAAKNPTEARANHRKSRS